jgi:hypothetical protein
MVADKAEIFPIGEGGPELEDPLPGPYKIPKY